MVIELTLDQLKNNEHLTDGYATVIMFYGATCGPCKATIPFYEEVSTFFTERNAKIKFYKFHAWENGDTQTYTREQWNVNGVPQFNCLFGNVTNVKAGGGDFAHMKQYVETFVNEVFHSTGAKI